MASEAARAARNHEARKRLTAALEALQDRLGVPVPPKARTMRDPGLQPIVEIERFADFAEAVLAAIPEDLTATVVGLMDEIAAKDKEIAALKTQVEKAKAAVKVAADKTAKPESTKP